VYIALHKYFEGKFAMKYSQTEIVDNVADIKHPLFRECLLHTNTTEPLEITSFADIPANGSGLGSSSTFAVGLINALLAQQGRSPSYEKCARGACEVEIEKLGEPIGKQDQYAAAFGGLNHIRFNADGSVHVNPILMPKDKYLALMDNLVMFYTGVTRKASSILSEQKLRCEKDEEQIKNMIAMRDQADLLRDELSDGNVDIMGDLLHEGWIRKKKMSSGISTTALDEIYYAAMRAGASGGKLLGAGGGGFFLFYCRKENQPNLIKELGCLRHIDFRFERRGTRITYTDF
jgi:D-glycero-alpha-D-manno-heptose-7-phosphate kinase